MNTNSTITRHPILLSAMLVSYMSGITAVQATLRDASTDTVNDALQVMTSLCFGIVAYVLYAHGGGVQAWPSIIPLAMLQAFTYIALIALKSSGLRGPLRRLDGYVSMTGVIMFTALSLYAIIPNQRKWARHVGVIACVLFGLPIAYAIPPLLRKQKGTNTDEETEIQRAVGVSDLVYSRNKTSDYEEVEFVHDQSTGARCGVYVEASGERIYLAFAGSDSKVDWLRTNLDVGRETYPFAKECTADHGTPAVHQGFLAAWKSIRDKVWGIVGDVMIRRGGSGRLVLCGHSLGGALATIAALDIYCMIEPRYQKTLSVITFGAPKVGTKEFQKAFDANIPKSSRVVTIYDPVPKIVINDFVHVKGEYVVSARLENPVSSHFLGEYAKALQKTHMGLAIPVVGLVTLLVAAYILQKV